MTRLAAGLLLALSPQAFVQNSLIRPGREGRYPLTRVDVVRPHITQIGTLAGYEISELHHDVIGTSLGKQMATDSRGGIWYLESRADRLVRIDPADFTMTRYALPAGTAPYSIDSDQKDVLWIASYGSEMLLESHPDESYAVAHRPPSRGFLNHVRVDSRRNVIWFSQPGNNQIVSYEPANGFREYELPQRQAGPGRLDVDADGNVWVPEMYTSRIAKLSVASGEWREWLLPSREALPAFCRVDRAGDVWISETAVDRIARFNGSDFREYAVPTDGSITSTSIADREDRVWFTEGGFRGSQGGNKIAVLDPRSGAVVELLLPTRNAQPVALVRDGTDTIWFGQSAAGRIGRAVPRRTNNTTR
jgi:virginiamycin B lyase